MRRTVTIAAAFLAGALVMLIGGVMLQPVEAHVDEPVQIPSTFPTALPTVTLMPTRTVAPTALPTQTQAPGAIGWTGQVQCYNCTPLAAKVLLTHYNPSVFDPMRPQLNCWDYSEPHKYCLSPTWIGVPWESGWGLWAACPAIWAVGTWVEVPGVITSICMDQGGEIDCENGVCRVDILGPGGAVWDGKTFDATLWVPRSWLIRFSEREK